MAVEYLTLGDYLVIAEVTLGIPAEELARYANLGLVDSALHAPAAGTGDTDFYPDLATKAAVLCSRLVRNHPLPDGNKRVAYECLRTFLVLNGHDLARVVTDAPWLGWRARNIAVRAASSYARLGRPLYRFSALLRAWLPRLASRSTRGQR